MRGISVTRLQIPMTPGFAVTEYKVRGATFRTAVLDLHKNTKSGDKGLHKRFCSIYVQLSRLQTLDGVQLLQPITLDDIGSKPHPTLSEESLNLNDRSDRTLSLWTYQFNQRRLV